MESVSDHRNFLRNVVYFRYYVELASLTLLIINTSAVLLSKGQPSDSAEVREDFLYEHVLTQPIRFAGRNYTSVYVSECLMSRRRY